jgi:hypothetical protein
MNDISIQEETEKYIEIARKDLERVLEKLKAYDDLMKERNRLEALINYLTNFLSSKGPATVYGTFSGTLQPVTGHAEGIVFQEKPLLEGVIEILREIGRPMKLSEIANEFYRRYWKLSKRNGPEILRNTMKKKLNSIFVKVNQGVYDLKERALID